MRRKVQRLPLDRMWRSSCNSGEQTTMLRTALNPLRPLNPLRDSAAPQQRVNVAPLPLKDSVARVVAALEAGLELQRLMPVMVASIRPMTLLLPPSASAEDADNRQRKTAVN